MGGTCSERIDSKESILPLTLEGMENEEEYENHLHFSIATAGWGGTQGGLVFRKETLHKRLVNSNSCRILFKTAAVWS